LRIYRHRVNTIEALSEVPPELGVELDLRSDGPDVIVTHDAFTRGPRIDEYLARVGARPCIFNVKCEGIEDSVLDAARRAGVEDFFFLDLSVPAAVRLSRRGERRIAVRWSEVEPVEAVRIWKGLADWVWVDCFTHYPGNELEWRELSESFRVCLVAPELQGHDAEAAARLRESVRAHHVHAVCTKAPDQWRSGR
jgi:hypothetical protein